MELAQTVSQDTQQSLDSSAAISMCSSFNSTQSLSQEAHHKITQPGNILEGDEFNSPIEKPRLNEESRKSDLFGDVQQAFVGFVGFGKMKQISINASKLKRAKQFMDDTQMMELPPSGKKVQEQDQKSEDEISEGTQSLASVQLNKDQKDKFKDEPSDFPDFSLGFKNMGSGAMFQVSEEASNKAKLFFSQFDQSQTNKETKTKQIRSQLLEAQISNNYLKTQKSKVPCTKPAKKPVAKPCKKPAINPDKQLLDGIIAKPVQNYKGIKLKDMPEVTTQQQAWFAQYWSGYRFASLSHRQQKCAVKWCYFCQKYKNQQLTLTRQSLKQEIKAVMSFHESTVNRMDFFVDFTIFKLSRFQFFDEKIANKQLNCNNLLFETYKKCLACQKGTRGPLQLSLTGVIGSRGKNPGKQIILLVLDIAENKDMGMYFLELTDGWSRVYAVLARTNILSTHINRKIYPGSKIELVNWTLHPICNILEHHPDPSASPASCIEFTYNNSRPAPYFSKLGWPSEPFFKPLSRYIEHGGPVPLLQGIIIRMYTVKSAKGPGSSFVEVLLSEGGSVVMRVVVAEQISLVELFRLYDCYHFVRVRIGVKRTLQFVGGSKFYEVTDTERIAKVRAVLQQRLVTKSRLKEMIAQAIANKKKYLVDIVTNSARISIDNQQIWVEEKIQCLALLQQYTLAFSNDRLILSKGDRGSCLRKIPKVYDSFTYDTF